MALKRGIVTFRTSQGMFIVELQKKVKLIVVYFEEGVFVLHLEINE